MNPRAILRAMGEETAAMVDARSPRVYVCGGSSELDLVARHMHTLRAWGYIITRDWVSVVRSNGSGNPRDATHKARLRWSADDIRGIEEASIVWALLPVKPSFGCAFEIGYAVGHGERVIVSGDWRATIFSAQAEARFNEHEHALEWLRLYGTPGSWEEEMIALEAE
jgi:hypothetical protein